MKFQPIDIDKFLMCEGSNRILTQRDQKIAENLSMDTLVNHLPNLWLPAALFVLGVGIGTLVQTSHATSAPKAPPSSTSSG